MKQFLKFLFASILGILIGGFILAIIGVILVVGLLSSSSDSIQYKEKNVLLLQKTITIGEISTPETPSALSSFNQTPEIGLCDFLRTLECAAFDSNIAGIVLDDATFDASYATLNEIAEGLENFKKSGKFVLGYWNTLSQKDFLVASACDKISMNNEGCGEFHGIAAQSIHYKNLLEKIGLKPVVIRCGKFKSYVESVTNNKMSEENRLQTQAYIDDIWKTFRKEVVKRRHITENQIDTLATNTLICLPQEMLAAGCIDTIQYHDEFWNDVTIQMSCNEKDYGKISFRTYFDEKFAYENADTLKNNPIALVIAQGSIDMGKSDESSIGSDTYTKIFKKVREDSTIQAVVFRINSGGGSSLASELIWREVALTAQQKPVIISMGDMAASGGYYIASPAAKIFASPMGITGSIGVFGMSMTAENLLGKIGIQCDTVRTHPHADFGSLTRDLDPTEQRAIEKTIDQTYATFKQRVADGRHLSLDSVEAIAQGRVWSVTDAYRNGLIDSIGNLSDAILYTYQILNLNPADYHLAIYPKERTLSELIFDELGTQSSVIEQFTKDEKLTKLLKNIPLQSGSYAQIPYTILLD